MRIRCHSLLTLGLLLSFSFHLHAQTRTSVATGNFNVPGTWDCTCVPGTGEDIVIANGDTVSLVANTTVNAVTINSGGVMDNNGSRLTATGNYVINGTHIGAGDIWLTGNGTTIDGTGLIANSNDFEIRNFSKTILATANFSKTTGGAVRIIGANTLTNKGTLTTDRNVVGNNIASTFVNDTNATLNAGRAFMNNGVITASAPGNSVNFNRTSGGQAINPATGGYRNLSTNGLGNRNLTGNIEVLGDLTINGATLRSRDFNITLKGDFNNPGGLFTEESGIVIFDGTSDQNITGITSETFYSLRVDKSSGVLIAGLNIIASDTLNLVNGVVRMGSNTLQLGVGTAATGTLQRTNGYIDGSFARWVNVSGLATLFPVGNSTTYNPATVTFTNITSGLLTVSKEDALPGNSGLPLLDAPDSVFNTFIEGYWDLAGSNGLASSNYTLEVEATGFSSYTITGGTRLLIRSNASSDWGLEGSHVAAVGSTIERSGLSSVTGQFGLGDTSACNTTEPVTSAITGSDTVCTNDLGSAYSVTNNPGNSYHWTIVGGTQASGGTTNSITVDWGATGMEGSVSVIEQDGCAYGDNITLNVAIGPLAPGTITGLTSVEQNTTGVAYSVVAVQGYTYNWTITGGTQASGGTTNSITVDWGTATSGQVSVTSTNACGTSSAENLSVNVYENITSIATGDWGVTTTWDCSCVPGISDNAVIAAGHVVSLTANQNINILTINSTGELASGTSRLRVYEDMDNDGTYSGGGRLEFRGTTGTLSGTGSFATHTGDVYFYAGSHDIAAEVNLTKNSGNVRLNNVSTLNNYGTVSVPTGNIIGNNAAATWVNQTGSSLTSGRAIMSTGILQASATNNTVAYNRTGTSNQTIKLPDANQYYNLTIDGDNAASDKRLAGNTEILGDLTITGGTFDASTSNFSTTLYGDWNNTSGAFDARAGLVTLAGGAQGITQGSLETFYNLTTSGSGIKTMNVPIEVEADLVINSGSTLDVNDAQDNQLTLMGDLTVNGTLNMHEANLQLEGSAAQQLDAGTQTVYDMTVDNGSGVSISTGTWSLTGTLVLTNGNFATNNALTLVSNASGTARIDEITGGSISGDITMQRFIAAGATNWRFLTAPVSGATIAQWNDDFITSGFTGSDFPTFSFTSILEYDESAAGSWTNGYTGVTNVTNSLNPGKGFWVWSGDSLGGTAAFTVDVTGPANTGNIALPVTFTSTGILSEDGWSMVGNPYPSTIDWDDANWTKANLDDAVYIWNPQNEQYAAYIGGLGTNGGSNLIASSQGFWVKANAASPSLIAAEGVKSSTDQAFIRAKAPVDHIRITAENSKGYKDEGIIVIRDQATDGIDGQYDALKLKSTHQEVPSLSLLNDTVEFSINAIDKFTADRKVDLKIEVKKTGSYTLNIDPALYGGSAGCLVLEDRFLNTTNTVGSGLTYNCVLSDTTTTSRFVLHLGAPLSEEVTEPSCKDMTDGRIEVKGTGVGPWTYTWKDASGTTIKTSQNLNTEDYIDQLAAGTYMVEVTNNGVCGVMNQEYVLENPPAVVADFMAADEELLRSEGWELVLSNLSANAEHYEWNFGDGFTSIAENPVHTYQNAGVYQVMLKAVKASCEDEKELTIEVVDDLVGVDELTEASNVNVFWNGASFRLEGQFDKATNVRVEVSNTLGQVLHTMDLGKVKHLSQDLEMPHANGVLFVNVIADGNSEVFKLSLVD